MRRGWLLALVALVACDDGTTDEPAKDAAPDSAMVADGGGGTDDGSVFPDARVTPPDGALPDGDVDAVDIDPDGDVDAVDIDPDGAVVVPDGDVDAVDIDPDGALVVPDADVVADLNVDAVNIEPDGDADAADMEPDAVLPDAEVPDVSECAPGDERACVDAPCPDGVQVCEGGFWSRCNYPAEACDGADNDCDERVDEGAGGGPLVEVCYEGPADTVGVGVCRAGRTRCVGGDWGACEGQVEPADSDVCNGRDDDCNGEIDDAAGTGVACGDGVGACRRDGETACDARSGEVVCTAVAGNPAREVCNGADDDCDGEVDNVIRLGAPCFAGLGPCRRPGRLVCGEGPELVCDAVPGEPEAEVCDAVDNDCNGEVDDVAGVGDACEVGEGACVRAGQMACADGPEPVCDADVGAPVGEECNGLDDDCDGEVDNLEGACSAGRGSCLQLGVRDCAEGVEVCAELGPEADADACAGPGCDGELGSGLVFDVCGVCGGDGNGCNPESPVAVLEGKQLWYQADRLYDVDLGDRPVAEWPGVDGLPLAAQGAGDRQPTLVQNAFNGHSALRFDGGDRLDVAQHVFAAGGGPHTVFVVMRTEDPDALVVGAGESGNGNLTSYGHKVGLSAGGGFVMVREANRGSIGFSPRPVNDGAPHVVSAYMVSGQMQFFLDGMPGPVDTRNWDERGYSRTSIGASNGQNNDGMGDPFVGDIAEILVFAGRMDDGDRQLVESWLAEQYGIPLVGPLGCDGEVFGPLRYDECGVCGGDDSSCNADEVHAAEPAGWFRADDLDPNHHDGQLVSFWGDATGRNHARQPGLSRAPTFHRDVVNGHAVVRFTDDRLDLDINDLGAGSIERTFFAVVRTEDDSGHLFGTSDSGNGNLSSYGTGLGFSGGAPFVKVRDANRGPYIPADRALADNTPMILSGVGRRFDSALYVNGHLEARAYNDTDGYQYTRTTMGAGNGSNNNGMSELWNGDIAEIVYFNRALGDEERVAVERYLATRYGLDLEGPRDCEGELYGRSALDACGVCGGDGSECGADAVLDAQPWSWVRARDLVHSTRDGQRVSRWPDQSVNGNDARSQDGRRPWFVAEGVGGHPSIRFDDAQRMDYVRNLMPDGALERSVFVVLKTEDADGHVVGSGDSGNGNLTSYGSGIAMVGGNPFLKIAEANRGLRLNSGLASADGAPHVVSGVGRNGRSAIKVDGRPGGVTFGGTDSYRYSVTSIGAGNGSNNNGLADIFSGQIAEIILFDRAVTEEEREAIDTYLHAAYDLAPQGPTGCDGDVSGVAWDACGVCGGDGSDCESGAIVGDPDEGESPPVFWVRAHDLADHAAQQWVGEWGDVSGAGNDARMASQGFAPRFVPERFNGLPAVRFEGNQRMDLVANLFPNGGFPRTVFMVLSVDEADGDGHLLGRGSSSNGQLTSYGDGLALVGGAPVIRAVNNSAGIFARGVDLRGDPGAPTLVTGALVNGANDIWVQGRPAGHHAGNPNPYSRYTKTTIGAGDGSNNNGRGEPFVGDIAEIIVFDEVLSATRRVAIERLLATKYGIEREWPVDCEETLDGDVQFDACGVCGGDGSSCNAAAIEALEPTMWLQPHELRMRRDGEPVQFWADASGNREDVRQSSRGRAPVFRPGLFGDFGSVRFDGAQRLDLRSNLFHPANLPASAYLVLRTEDDSAHLLGTNSSSNGNLLRYGAGVQLAAGMPWLVAVNNAAGMRIAGSVQANHGTPVMVGGVMQSGASVLETDCRGAGRSGANLNAYDRYPRSTIGAGDGSANNGLAEPFVGEIAEVLVFSRGLDDAERVVVSDYLGRKYGFGACRDRNDLPPAEAILDALSFWTLDEDGPGVRVDQGFAGLDLTPGPDELLPEAVVGIAGGAQSFDGTQYLIRSEPGVAGHDTETFSISAWVRLDDVASSQTLIGKWTRGNDNRREFLLWYNGAREAFEFRVSSDGTEGPFATAAARHPTDVQSETWYHLEAWFDHVGDVVGLRVSPDGAVGDAVTVEHGRNVFQGDAPLMLGAHGGASAPLRGQLDAVGIWLRLLGDEEWALLRGGLEPDFGAAADDE